MSRLSVRMRAAGITLTLSAGMFVAATGVQAQSVSGGRIGYVLTERHWSLYQTEDAKTECPQGFNIGPREQFAELFPQEDGALLTEAETRLVREGRRFHLETSEEPFPFYDAVGPNAYGLNLDSKATEEDFISPAGVEGVDNQLNRALACVAIYRGPDGAFYHFSNLFMYGNAYNRWMIEITGVDDLSNDDSVTVNFYRGLDDLVTDASGKGFVAGGTQRVDGRWGDSFRGEVQGRIVDGVLTTEAAEETKFPWSFPGIGGGFHIFKDFQLQLTLTPDTAKGLLAGYVDVEQYNHRLNRNWTTHHQSYGQLSAASLYRAMKRLADGHPDPQSGENTAISSAVDVEMHQVFIVHPDDEAMQLNTAQR
ncbi:hypothetical protein [Congregibacter litoralis]|uniref:Uncharacterized protein n=1 Tax=Congregibacter litoralis KT71 TaxID=314285 RepID=A4ADK8_9GAMM|nr:hypothetical protein [Congregibacter litoralis]EAQ95897.2 hypothetical protein KT71_11625 [Congregibacter litoralis KT71]